jgi:hypothetical protein
MVPKGQPSGKSDTNGSNFWNKTRWTRSHLTRIKSTDQHIVHVTSAQMGRVVLYSSRCVAFSLRESKNENHNAFPDQVNTSCSIGLLLDVD